jgi:hypothetical protein
VQNKFYILEREQGTGNREQIRNTEIFLFSKNVKLILLRYLLTALLTNDISEPNFLLLSLVIDISEIFIVIITTGMIRKIT